MPHRAIHSVVVYTRPGCCLCDEAIELLQDHGLDPRMINIDADPELQARFTSCVPVIEIDGAIRFRGRVNSVLLKRLMG